MQLGNVMVGQSGGPTAVINASLVGVFQAAKELGATYIYGMRYGVEGLLDEQYINLSNNLKSALSIELLKRTPASYLGSCRYKMPDYEQDETPYLKLFSLFRKLDIKHFFYIGGNDSMDTIDKLSQYAKLKNSDIRFIGIPKTIDNDLTITDHTPGYGSAAKFIGTVFKEVIRDSQVYTRKSVTLVEIMGRNAGWLTAAASLSHMDDCPGPDMVLLPEVVFDMEAFLFHIQQLQKKKNSLIVAVSEGIKLADGRYVCELQHAHVRTDAFGHKDLAGTASCLSNFLVQESGVKSRYIELSTLQRCSSHIVSRIDINEAFLVGGHGIKAAARGETGKMICLERISDDPYHVTTKTHDVHLIANLEKKFPLEWLTPDSRTVTREFLTYCRPLIQEELPPIMVDGLPQHLYDAL